jgi:hypothetical protein
MSKAIHPHNGDTIDASRGVNYSITRGASITFMDAFNDNITVTGSGAKVKLGAFSQNNNIVDHGRGMQLTLDTTAFTTICGFQNDPTGHIDLYHSGINSAAELAAHTFVSQNSTIITIPHGLVLTLVGDTNLRPGQITWHS